jgi:hypothetical protein
MCHKDGTSVKDNGLWGAMIADNVRYIELDILSGPVCGGYGYKVG